jgi:hypothetical protein
MFEEQSTKPLSVDHFEHRSGAPLVAAPERAILELLSEVGVRQPLQEARKIMEGTCNLRADILDKLLSHRTSVKTVRLCLQLGRELKLNWFSKLDATKLPTGSDRPWVSKSKARLARAETMNQVYLRVLSRFEDRFKRASLRVVVLIQRPLPLSGRRSPRLTRRRPLVRPRRLFFDALF